MDDSNLVSHKELNIYRFLSESICYSYYINPRNLELYSYSYWNAELIALAQQIDSQSREQTCVVSPQLPIYISSSEPDDPELSFQSQPDSQSRGVHVDLSLVMPILHPRPLSQTPAELYGRKLSYFFQEYIDGLLQNSQPITSRHLRLVGLITPILAEIKRPPPRRPENIASFITALEKLLVDAKRQAVLQAHTLFVSWQYRFEGHQEFVILIAGVGPYYSLGVYARSQATVMWEGLRGDTLALRIESFKNSIQNLTVLKSEEADKVMVLDDDVDLSVMIGDPNMTFAQQKKQADEERDARAAKRSHMRSALEEATNRAPNYTAYDQPVFSQDALLAAGPRLFQTDDILPTFFTDHNRMRAVANDAKWTGLYILGSQRSDRILKVVVEVVKEEFREPELARRERVFFPSET